MTLSGLGCRLQTCSCLATEWFNSTFRARLTVDSFLPAADLGRALYPGSGREPPPRPTILGVKGGATLKPICYGDARSPSTLSHSALSGGRFLWMVLTVP